MKILGIDPGLANTGWAVIEVVQGGQPAVIETGLITTDNKTIQAQRIAVIVTNIVAVMERFDAEHVAMERVFVGPRNMRAVETAEVIGALRYRLWLDGFHVVDYAPTTVKKTVTGKGNATKGAVAAGVARIIGHRAFISNHESDAIAVALTHWRKLEERRNEE